MNWNTLDKIDQLEEIYKASFQHPVVIFKHSTHCGISTMVLKNFETEIKQQNQLNSEFYFLDLIKDRAVSNAVAEKFGVIHQSPQLIVIKNGRTVHHASHYSINLKEVS
jgi:bacillithiol system protein YtxJ